MGADALVALLQMLGAFFLVVFRFHSEILSPCTRRPRKAHVSCNGNNRKIRFTNTTKETQIMTGILNLYIISLYLYSFKWCENVCSFSI